MEQKTRMRRVLRFFATRVGVAVLALLVLLPLLLLLSLPPLLRQEPQPQPLLAEIGLRTLTPAEIQRLQEYVVERTPYEVYPEEPLRLREIVPARQGRVPTPKPGDVELLACAARQAERPRVVVEGSRERRTHCPGL